MENWIRGLTKQMAMILGFFFILAGLGVLSIIQGAIGGGIFGGLLAMAVILLHKGFTGITLKEKMEAKHKK